MPPKKQCLVSIGTHYADIPSEDNKVLYNMLSELEVVVSFYNAEPFNMVTQLNLLRKSEGKEPTIGCVFGYFLRPSLNTKEESQNQNYSWHSMKTRFMDDGMNQEEGGFWSQFQSAMTDPQREDTYTCYEGVCMFYDFSKVSADNLPSKCADRKSVIRARSADGHMFLVQLPKMQPLVVAFEHKKSKQMFDVCALSLVRNPAEKAKDAVHAAHAARTADDYRKRQVSQLIECVDKGKPAFWVLDSIELDDFMQDRFFDSEGKENGVLAMIKACERQGVWQKGSNPGPTMLIRMSTSGVFYFDQRAHILFSDANEVERMIIPGEFGFGVKGVSLEDVKIGAQLRDIEFMLDEANCKKAVEGFEKYGGTAPFLSIEAPSAWTFLMPCK